MLKNMLKKISKKHVAYIFGAVIIPFSLISVLTNSSAKLFHSKDGTKNNNNNISQPGEVPGGVTVDFTSVQMYPYIKSKIGFASNVKNEGLLGSVPYLDKIGPGMFCANVEFDQWYKSPNEINPALIVDPTSGRPLTTKTTPAPWLGQFETGLSKLNIATLEQVTGAPAQYQQPKASKPAIHPAPTDINNAAVFYGEWTKSQNHAAPVLFSLWNEPGHTFNDVDKNKDVEGNKLYKNETKEEYDARRSANRSASVLMFGNLYRGILTQSQGKLNSYSQLGAASFLAGDFKSEKVTTEGKEFFPAVYENIKNSPNSKSFTGADRLDFIAFNSFNGKWLDQLNGVQNEILSTGNRTTAPIIFTQYAPKSLKIPEGDDGADNSPEASAIGSGIARLNDLDYFVKDPAVQSVCHTYWLGGKNAFVSLQSDGSYQMNYPYYVYQMYGELPTVRVKVGGVVQDDYSGNTNGLHAMAGKNYNKSAVLFWNDSKKPIDFTPNFVKTITSPNKTGTIKVLSSDIPQPVVTAYTEGTEVSLQPDSLALISFTDPSFADPNERRQAVTSNTAINNPNKAIFLRTFTRVNRINKRCSDQSQDNPASCLPVTKEYGFFDQVRDIAYLGITDNGGSAQTGVAYANLSDKVSFNYKIISGADGATPDIQVTLPKCPNSPVRHYGNLYLGPASNLGSGVAITVDLKQIASESKCNWDDTGRVAEVMFSLQGKPGAQAEVYMSSSQDVSSKLAGWLSKF